MLVDKDNKIFLSIIIPFYNSKKFLFSSINHVQEIINKFNDIEIIYVNDGSTDIPSKLILKKFKKFKNIKLYNLNRNLGPGIARNFGIKKSKGRKIIFLDIEDKLEINNLKSFFSFLRKYNENIFFNYKIFPKNKNFFDLLPSYKNNMKKCSHFLNTSCDKAAIFTCFEKEFLIKKKVSFKKGFHEDIFFMFKIYFYSKKKLVKFNKVIYLKYDHQNSITGKFRLKNLNDLIISWKQIVNFIKKKNLFELKKDLQFRLRGEYVNLFLKINLVKQNNLKTKMRNFLNNNLLTIIKKKYIIKTDKDKFFKKILVNEKKI